MPLVSPNPTLRDALASYIAQTSATKAEAATTLSIDPMTLARFLKTGRAIDANRRKLEAGLARVGAWAPSEHDAIEKLEPSADAIVLSDKVISALEFLLSAARTARAGS